MYEEDLRILQTDFYAFYLYIMENIKGTDELTTGKYEEDLCDFLEYEIYKKYLEEERPIATIEAPVQHGKSSKLRVFTTWLLGREENTYFNFYTADDRLRAQTNDMINSIINSKEYKQVFNDIVIKSIDTQIKLKNRNQLDFRLMGEGNTGYPSNISIIDDPYRNREDANSETIREKVEQRFRGDIMSRRQKKSMVIIMHSRWHKNDLIGTIKQDEYLKNVILSKKYKAINDKGEALFPELRDIKFLEEQRKLLGTYNFNALYQQEPNELGGNIIKTEWFKTYSMLPKCKKYYITGDTAFTTKSSGDYSVFQLWGKDSMGSNSNYYLIDMIRGKWEAPELLNNLLNFYTKWKTKYLINCLYIENKASGIGLIQQIKRLRIPIKEINPTKDKYTRLSDILPIIESGYVYLPEIADWKSDFICECEDFKADMTHKHDDQIDSMSYALSEEINHNSSWNYVY